MSDTTDFSLESAREAADRGELAAWVACFLASPGSDNPELAEELTHRLHDWEGPIEVPMNRLHRLAGPPDEPVLCPVDDEYWDDRVDDMAEKIEHDDDWEPSPVIACFRNDQLVLEDGNHRVESLRRAGRTHAWTLIGFEDDDARDRFRASASA